MLLLAMFGAIVTGLAFRNIYIFSVGLICLLFYIYPSQTSLALASIIGGYYIKDKLEL